MGMVDARLRLWPGELPGYLFSCKGVQRIALPKAGRILNMAQNVSERPNVLVFFTDQQRWDTTGVHGNPMGLTPNFDAMARRGTHAAYSFTCQPVCGPARSCLQTGLYATTTGCFKNGVPLPQDARTLAHHFRDVGYTTGYIGKWHLAGEEPVPEAKRGGYEYWLASNALEGTSDAYDTVMYDSENRAVKLPGYRVDALTDAAIPYYRDAISTPNTGRNRLRPLRDQPGFSAGCFVTEPLEPHHQNKTRNAEYKPACQRWDPGPVCALAEPLPSDGLLAAGREYRERYTGGFWMPPVRDLANSGWADASAHQHLPGDSVYPGW